MNKYLTVALAIAAGSFGGVVRRYVAPPFAFAQNQRTTTPTEIRAQSFTFIQLNGETIATFTTEPGSGPSGLKS